MRQHHLLLFVFFLFLAGCKKESSDNPFAGVYLNNPTDGNIIISPFNSADHSSGVLMVLDKNANIIKKIPTRDQAVNFTKWNYEGKTRYSYVEYSYNLPQISVIYGQAVVLDENYNEIRRFNLLPFNGRTAADPNGFDSHDFILLGDDHYIGLTSLPQAVNNIPAALNPVADANVFATVIQEVNNGQVVWEWNSTNYPEFYQNSVEGNAFSTNAQTDDYMHCNSMYVDTADNNLVCSFRNQDQVVKIKRYTGEIMWRLGGKDSDFPMLANQHFLRQHNATVLHDANGPTILLVDNGLRGTREYSRILEINLDEPDKAISGFREFDIPNTFIEFTGSVQKRGSTYFIGGGTAKNVLEYNYQTGERLFELDLSNSTYRAFKY